MDSKEQIKEDLQSIAKDYGYQGEALNIIVDLLTYAIFHEQFDFLNTSRELSLDQATLMNSKIQRCIDVLYAVYRGRNPRIWVNVQFDGPVHRNKFDQLFDSNTFKIYAANQIDGWPDGKTHLIECIIAKRKLEVDNTINQLSKYYLDFKEDGKDGNLYNNISEDIQVSVVSKGPNQSTLIDKKVYPTTRLLSDHTRYDGDEEQFLAITLPDFGLRLFRKNYFPVSSIIKIEAFNYISLDDINIQEIDKLAFEGMTLVPAKFHESNDTITDNDKKAESDEQYLNIVDDATYEVPLIEYNSSSMLEYGYTIFDRTERDNIRTLLYNANLASRVNSEIKSNSDVNYLFTEVFRDRVLGSNFEYIKGETRDLDYLQIYYIPRVNTFIVKSDKDNFINNYGAYFLTNNIQIDTAVKKEINITVEAKCSNSDTIAQDILDICKEYENVLEASFNINYIRSQISKLSNVIYVEKIEYKVNGTRPTPYNDTYEAAKNEYFEFNVNVGYL